MRPPATHASPSRILPLRHTYHAEMYTFWRPPCLPRFFSRAEALTRIAEYCEYNHLTYKFLENFTGEKRPLIGVCASPYAARQKRAHVDLTGLDRPNADTHDEDVPMPLDDTLADGAPDQLPPASPDMSSYPPRKKRTRKDGREADVDGSRWLAHEAAVCDGSKCSFTVVVRSVRNSACDPS